MENLEVCNLVLNENDISISDIYTDYPMENNIGKINNIRNVLRFKNINFRNLLGDMYDKYDTFNLRLTGVNGSNIAYGSATIDRLHIINITGLPWINCSYNTSLKCNTNVCQIGSFVGATSTSFNVNFESSLIATFSKIENTDIEITLLRIDGIAPSMVANTLLPRLQFFFMITGIK
jgi:hypothetical protein